MKNTLKISLKPNEKIYINGAVIKVDRKVTLELLNDVQFLLESHVLQLERGLDAAAPALLHPAGHADEPERRHEAYEMFRKSLPLMLASFEDGDLRRAQADRPHGRRRPCLRSAEGDPFALSARNARRSARMTTCRRKPADGGMGEMIR